MPYDKNIKFSDIDIVCQDSNFTQPNTKLNMKVVTYAIKWINQTHNHCNYLDFHTGETMLTEDIKYFNNGILSNEKTGRKDHNSNFYISQNKYWVVSYGSNNNYILRIYFNSTIDSNSQNIIFLDDYVMILQNQRFIRKFYNLKLQNIINKTPLDIVAILNECENHPDLYEMLRAI